GRNAHVIAPDLLGHGRSAKPPSGDYSLGPYAAGLRDLLVALGVRRAHRVDRACRQRWTGSRRVLRAACGDTAGSGAGAAHRLDVYAALADEPRATHGTRAAVDIACRPRRARRRRRLVPR